MLPSQTINLVPNPQAESARPGRTGSSRAKEAARGIFGDMLSNKSGQAVDGAANTAKETRQAPPVQPEAETKTEIGTETEDANNILPFPILLAINTNPENPQVNKALRLLETIAAILEGDQGNNLNIKEIAPLLQELEQIMQELKPDTAAMEKLLPKFEKLLEEVQARTPLNEEIADAALKSQIVDKLTKLVGEIRGYPSPLENVSEENHATLAEAPETEAVQLKNRLAAGHKQHEAGEQDGRSGQHNEQQAASTIRVDMAPHKVFFAEHAQAAASAPRFIPLTPDSLFDAMVERIVALPGAEPHMEIELKPDHLGKLSIDLSLGEQGLVARIIASDEGVRNMLAAQINRLSETLAEKGISVENVEIIYSALSDKPFDQRQPEQQGRNDNNRPPLWGVEENLAGSLDNFYVMSPYTDEWGFSSVEYRA